MPLNKSAIVVAVYMITYNHENYIEQAIESVISQKTDFKFKLFIGEDCSSDNTRQICSTLKEKYPDKIELVLNNINIGASLNAKNIFNLCFTSGANYIAILEGDDYWTDPYKLQKQVDFLEANPDYVLSFHKVKILKTNDDLVEDFITKAPENYETQETLARLGNYIHTPSVVFRNVISKLPPEFLPSPIGDYFLYMLLTEHGKVKRLDDTMAVYREGVGVWSGQSDYFRNFKTAQTQALIISAMSKNTKVVEILNARLINFLESFKNEIKPTDLMQLNTCNALEETLFTTLQNNQKQNNKNTVDALTTKDLLKIVFKRIKKRLWK